MHVTKTSARSVAILLALAAPFVMIPAGAQTPADKPAGSEATPRGSPPEQQPPPPPAQPPAPPGSGTSSSGGTTVQPAGNTGQWVYTSQYGWVWIPYGDEYVFTPADESADPYAYLYWPDHGWIWVVAPWVWGVGPLPFFGPFGPWHYHWYRGPLYHPRAPGRPLFHSSYAHPPGGPHPSGGGHHR